jgi:hypothetical protein
MVLQEEEQMAILAPQVFPVVPATDIVVKQTIIV